VLTVTNLPAGTHAITAVYSGDFNWYLLRSAPLTLTVSRTVTSTALAATATPTEATLTAAVIPAPSGGPNPGGTVQFIDTVSNSSVALTTLPASATNVTVTLNQQQIAAAGGHPLAAVYSGDANFAGSTSNAMVIPVLINSASGASLSFAAEEQVSLFGSNLAAATLLGAPLPLPTSLGGVTVNVTDSAIHPAGLILVSPGQLNFVMPAGIAGSTATVTVVSPSASVAPLRIPIAPVAPGIYSAGSNGKGLAAAQIIRVRADGTQTSEIVSPSPISFGSDTLYLVLYGTGIRGRSSIGNVSCTIGAATLPVIYAGAQPQYPGLDQVDVLLPASLKGSGQVNVTVIVDGQTSNPVTLTFQ
jgi:uncharacterized protein (TIGR03437 family)